MKSKFIESNTFLCLVDESTGNLIKFDVRTKQAETFLPLMALGMKIWGSTIQAIGIVSMFYPAISSALIPKDLLDKAQAGSLRNPKRVGSSIRS